LFTPIYQILHVATIQQKQKLKNVYIISNLFGTDPKYHEILERLHSSALVKLLL